MGSPEYPTEPGFSRNVTLPSSSNVFSNETHFHLDGHVNNQNCRYWDTQSAKKIGERPLHSEQRTGFCTISGQGISGPIDVEDNHGRMATLNATRYRKNLGRFRQWSAQALPSREEPATDPVVPAGWCATSSCNRDQVLAPRALPAPADCQGGGCRVALFLPRLEPT